MTRCAACHGVIGAHENPHDFGPNDRYHWEVRTVARCVNGSCNNDARFSVYRDDLANTYDGISWCSIRCMTSTPFESLRTAVPDWLVERPDTEAASGD